MQLRELYKKYEGLLNEYEELLLGNRRAFSDQYFGDKKPNSQRNALAVIQYAFERYLRWSPSVLGKRLTADLIYRLHLNTVIKYIKFPPEYNKERDYFFLVSLLYPKFKISLRHRITYVYKNMLTGVITKYPKDYFYGEEGMVRACVCLQYLIKDILHGEIRCPNDAYALFASEYGAICLKKNKLLKVCDELFETPVDFVHAALPDHEKDEFLYEYYKFLYYSTMVAENGTKKPVTLRRTVAREFTRLNILG